MEALAPIDQGSGIAQALIVAVPTPRIQDQDAVLVIAARAGDRSAFGQLYERHVRMVHGVVLARVPHRDVDDIVHDVFLAAFERLASLRIPPRSARGWRPSPVTARPTTTERRRHLPR